MGKYMSSIRSKGVLDFELLPNHHKQLKIIALIAGKNLTLDLAHLGCLLKSQFRSGIMAKQGHRLE